MVDTVNREYKFIRVNTHKVLQSHLACVSIRLLRVNTHKVSLSHLTCVSVEEITHTRHCCHHCAVTPSVRECIRDNTLRQGIAVTTVLSHLARVSVGYNC